MSYSNYEWTISRSSDNSYRVICVSDRLRLSACDAAYSTFVRPVFYLTNSVIYSEGDGTQSSPIRLSN